MFDPYALIGTEVDQYKIERHLARGGMADVYLAQNVELQRKVVLKVLLPAFAQEQNYVHRFRTEARAMARMHHANIVQIFRTGMLPNNQPYIAMQYVPGGTLADKLAAMEAEGQVLTVEYAVALVRQVTDALAVAHRAGIIHRDLKPSNILLERDGTPLLTDLGIAIVEDNARLTRTNVLVGTPEYMSPEQGKGDELDARSDIYALGVIMFELLAGKRPFSSNSSWALVNQHLTAPVPNLLKMRPEVPEYVVRVVETCLEKEPIRRYQSATQFLEALDQALQKMGAGGVETSSGKWQWAPTGSGEFFTERVNVIKTITNAIPKKSQRWVAYGAGAIVLLLIGVIGVNFILNDGGEDGRVEAAEENGPNAAAAVVEPTETATETVAEETATPLVLVVTATGEPTEPPTETAEATSTLMIMPTSTTMLATSTLVATSTAELPTSPQFQINFSSANVRTGPGVNYGVVDIVFEGDIVSILASSNSGNWYNVILADGTLGWISADIGEAVDAAALTAVTVAETIPAPPPTATATATPIPPTPVPSSGGNNNGGGGGNNDDGRDPTPPPPPPTAPSPGG